MMGYLFVMASILLTTLAQLSMKWGAMRLPDVSPALLFTPAHVWPMLAIVLGVACYVVSLLGWLSALRHLPLNIAYPLLSISYALVYLLAVCLPVFNETLTLGKTMGVALILLGAGLIGSKSAAGDKP